MKNLGNMRLQMVLPRTTSIAYPSDVLEEGMATTTNIEDAMDTGTIDMQPLDELGQTIQ